MLKLRQLQKKKQEEQAGQSTGQPRLSPGQLRIEKDLAEMEPSSTSALKALDSSNLNFEVTLMPDDGFYRGGRFQFKLTLSHNYPIEVPKVKCLNKIYHPNIDLDGNVCLNILREEWSPVLNLNALLIGLMFVFLDPNPLDPLNKESANVLARDKNLFSRVVKSTMNGGSYDGIRYDYVMK